MRVAGSQDASTAWEGVDKNGLGLEQVSGRCSFAERQRVGTRQVQGHSVIRPENAPGGVILFARECDPLVVLAQLDEQAAAARVRVDDPLEPRETTTPRPRGMA